MVRQVQFSGRHVVNSAQEFHVLEARLKRQKANPIATDMDVEDWRKQYPRTILTDKGAPLASMFWSLVMAGPEWEAGDVYSKRLRDLRKVFETMPVRALNVLARAIALKDYTAVDILARKLRGDSVNN